MGAKCNQLHTCYGVVGTRKSKSQIDKADHLYERNGGHYKKNNTAGWDMKVKFKYGSTSWLPLNTLKKHNPIDVAQCVFDNRLDSEPAYC